MPWTGLIELLDNANAVLASSPFESDKTSYPSGDITVKTKELQVQNEGLAWTKVRTLIEKA